MEMSLAMPTHHYPPDKDAVLFEEEGPNMVIRRMRQSFGSVLVALAGLGITAMAGAAQEVDPPGVYYSWRALQANVNQCLDRAANALASQSLDSIQADDTSVAGRSEEATAVFICMENTASTTVMVIVSSADEEEALTLREALKTSF
jgi:hypothetical protein